MLGSSGTMRSLFKAFFSVSMYRELFSSKGTAVISNPTQCLELMKKWEEARRQHCFAAVFVWWNLSPSAQAHAFYRCSPVCSFSRDLISARSSFSFLGRQPDVVISTALRVSLWCKVSQKGFVGSTRPFFSSAVDGDQEKVFSCRFGIKAVVNIAKMQYLDTWKENQRSPQDHGCREPCQCA